MEKAMERLSQTVSVEWLHENLQLKNLIILDASMESPADQSEEVEDQALIPNTLRFDFSNQFVNHASSVANMMPTEEKFEHEAQKLGINQDSIIVIYDNKGIFASARGWWMFKSMGHKEVYVLDGGLVSWLTHGYKVDSEYTQPIGGGNFIANFDESAFCDADDVLNAIDKPKVLIADARSVARFIGVEQDPRPGVRAGHIPNSVNIPYSSLLSEHEFKPVDELASIFSLHNIDRKDLVIFSCGSGVTACILLLVAYSLGHRNLTVYDGSWSEWGIGDRPVELGI